MGVPLPGRAGVHHVGHRPAVQVDPGEAGRAEDIRPDQPARPGEVVQPAHPVARAPHVHDGARLKCHRVTSHQFTGPVAGHHLANGNVRRAQAATRVHVRGDRADPPAFPVEPDLLRDLQVAASQRSATRSRQVSCQMLPPTRQIPSANSSGGNAASAATSAAPSSYRRSTDIPYCPPDSQTVAPSAISPWVNPRPGCGQRPHHLHPEEPHQAIISPRRGLAGP